MYHVSFIVLFNINLLISKSHAKFRFWQNTSQPNQLKIVGKLDVLLSNGANLNGM